MMHNAIETSELSKSCGPVRAVDSVNLRVRPGEIYGFIGLNGAGKTTTPELTVRENLEIARRLHGIADINPTSRVIKQLGLAPYADRKAGALSTGNLQRLGLARALVHEPELLILDEPANGLDPAGVAEIRELLVSLVRKKSVTVFMSSHILAEVDRLVTRIGIIHQGRLIEELEARQLEALRSQRLAVRARDLKGAQGALLQAGFSVKAIEGTLFLHEARAVDAPDQVAILLVNAGTPPTRLAVEQEDLEGYFLLDYEYV